MTYLINILFCIALSFSSWLAARDFQSHPAQNHTASHITAGNAHAKSGNHSQALAELNQAIAKDPYNARAYKLRGHVYYAMGDYKQSLQDLERVVYLAPDSPNAYCDRAIAHSMVGNHGAALLDVEHALNLKADSSFAQAVREKILERAQEQSVRK